MATSKEPSHAVQQDLQKARIRRRMIKGGAAFAAATQLPAWSLYAARAYGAAAPTEWGWPQPYEQVSPKSVEWLKSKGWWPLQVAWNPTWSDGNVVLFTMDHYKLLEKRGLEVQYSPFLAAGMMNEVFVPGKIQVAQAGSLGLLRIIDLKVPAVAVACYPAQRQAFLVPPDSPLKSLDDLKGQKVLKRPAVWAVTIGSTTHLGMLIAAKLHGLEENTDYVLRNVGPNDIIAMPKGIDISAMWEPNVILMTEFLKNARILELIDSYEVFNGYSYLRGEIEQNAPDVVQAYTDAFVEARLLARLRQKEVVDLLAADPSQRGRNPALIARDAEIHVFNPKPTLSFPFENTRGFWIPLEEYQAGIMADANVLKNRYSDADFKAVLRPSYMTNTYAKLGWNVPTQPSFIPADWAGQAGKPPYPPYGMMLMGRQPFPQSGDLAKEWVFAGKAYMP